MDCMATALPMLIILRPFPQCQVQLLPPHSNLSVPHSNIWHCTIWKTCGFPQILLIFLLLSLQILAWPWLTSSWHKYPLYLTGPKDVPVCSPSSAPLIAHHNLIQSLFLVCIVFSVPQPFTTGSVSKYDSAQCIIYCQVHFDGETQYIQQVIVRNLLLIPPNQRMYGAIDHRTQEQVISNMGHQKQCGKGMWEWAS